MKYDTNRSSIYLLQYHLILVIKYRRKVITNNICHRLEEIFKYIGEKEQYKLKVLEFNHELDHIHILFKGEPKSELSKFINAYKSASSRLIKREFPEVKKYLWKSSFWSRSFFLMTIGGAKLEVLKKYIENQGKNNR